MPKISLEDIVKSVNNRSNADFVNRLKQDNNRQTIPDWKIKGNVTTHKLGYAENAKGQAIVFPAVQNINGKLYDFTNPKYKHKNGML